MVAKTGLLTLMRVSHMAASLLWPLGGLTAGNPRRQSVVQAQARRGDHRLAGLDLAAECNAARSEEHTSELQSLMRISYAVFCLKKKNNKVTTTKTIVKLHL